MNARSSRFLVLPVVLTALLTACGASEAAGPGPGPDSTSGGVLSIDSVVPATGAVGTLWPAVRVFFDTTVNAATVTGANITLKEGATAIPAALFLDPAGRSLLVEGALLPSTSYTLQLGPGLKSAGGDTLVQPASFVHTTRAPATFDLVPAEAIVRQYVTVDPAGGRHLLSASFASQTIRYSFCPAASDCTLGGSWQTATVDSTGEPESEGAAFALDANGGVHVTYRVNATADLRYAECPANCGTSANWSVTTIDTAGNPAIWTAVLPRPAGGVAVLYTDWAVGGLRYAECAAGCGTAANWVTGPLPAARQFPQDVAMAYQGNGTLVATVRGQSNTGHPVQLYACAAACTDSMSWQAGVFDPSGVATRGAAMTVDTAGALHLVTLGSTGEVTYATCTADCAVTGSWTRAHLAVPGGAGGITPGIAVVHGRLAVVSGNVAGHLTLLTCRVGCTTATNWRGAEVSTVLGSGNDPRVALTPDGQPVMVTGATGGQVVE